MYIVLSFLTRQSKTGVKNGLIIKSEIAEPLLDCILNSKARPGKNYADLAMTEIDHKILQHDDRLKDIVFPPDWSRYCDDSFRKC